MDICKNDTEVILDTSLDERRKTKEESSINVTKLTLELQIYGY